MMIEIIQKQNESRKDYMLRVASAYIERFCPSCLIKYDDAECDGLCIAEECLEAVDGDE